MRDLRDLTEYWLAHSDTEMMLCTIVRKSGSGYRGIGAKKIIRRDGRACGFLSGGCLEGDIIRMALERWNEASFLQSFSTMSEEDRLMGYQTGCAGVIEILFERLPAELSEMHKYLPYGPKKDIAAISVSLKSADFALRTPLTVKPEYEDNIFIDSWIEPLELYVIGCGANARPFAELAPSLGWNVTFIDYRQGYNLPEVNSQILPLAKIGNAIPSGPRTAVVIMTHNYEADLAIAGQLNKKLFGYIGFIGPRKRFEQMREDLKKYHQIDMDEDWAKSVHSPAGLKQGRTPEDIAFSIIAEIQFGLAS